MSVEDWDLGDFYEGDGEQDPFGDKQLQRQVNDLKPSDPDSPQQSSESPPITKTRKEE